MQIETRSASETRALDNTFKPMSPTPLSPTPLSPTPRFASQSPQPSFSPLMPPTKSLSPSVLALNGAVPPSANITVQHVQVQAGTCHDIIIPIPCIQACMTADGDIDSAGTVVAWGWCLQDVAKRTVGFELRFKSVCIDPPGSGCDGADVGAGGGAAATDSQDSDVNNTDDTGEYIEKQLLTTISGRSCGAFLVQSEPIVLPKAGDSASVEAAQETDQDDSRVPGAILTGQLVLHFDNSYAGSGEKTVLYAISCAPASAEVEAEVARDALRSSRNQPSSKKGQMQVIQHVKHAINPLLEACTTHAEEMSLNLSAETDNDGDKDQEDGGQSKEESGVGNDEVDSGILGTDMWGSWAAVATGATTGLFVAGPVGAVVGGMAAAFSAGQVTQNQEIAHEEVSRVRKLRIRTSGMGLSGAGLRYASSFTMFKHSL